jgi:mono/diheme cytochrome c family protein
VLLAITGYEIGLLCTAAVFIAFALIVSLVVPRTHSAFPGRRLGVFLTACGVLFAAQLTAVFLLAYVGESNTHVAEAATTTQETTTTPAETTTTETTATETTATETTATETTATETTTGETTTTEGTTTETTTAPAGQGDPAAGKAIFTGSAGCSGCHTLADAGATGTVGPDLDKLKPSYEKVVTQVTNGGVVMPSFKGTLSAQQIQDVAAYVSSATGS